MALLIEATDDKSEVSESMNSLKRILAMGGVVLIGAIWIATFVIGVTGGPKRLLTAFLVLSVVVPVLLYAILLVARIVSGKPATDEIDAALKDGRIPPADPDKDPGRSSEK